MELILNRDQAMKAVDVARNFAEGASGLKVLQGALLSAKDGHVRLTTTDLGLWCQVGIDAQTPEPGEVLVPVKGLATVLKNMPGSRVQLRSEGDDVVCVGGSSEVRLKGTDVEEYPSVDEPEGRWLSMPLSAALVDRVAYAVSKDETRYTLNGVLLEVVGRQLRMVATDGHRLARFAGMLPPGSVCDAGEESQRAIVPARLLNEGVRLGGKLGGSVTLELCEKSAAIRVNGSIRLWTGLIDGQYPQYEGIIPSEFVGNVSVPKGALCSAVSRAAALSKGRRLAGVVLEMDGSNLVMRLGEDAGDSISSIERVSPARAEGTVPVCGLRINYLSDTLARLPDVSWVELRFTDDEGECPVVIQGPETSGAGLLSMIMPYKV